MGATMAEKFTTYDNYSKNESPSSVSVDGDTELARQYPRTELCGVACATIHPKEGEGGGPQQCAVLTRDVSLAGFGIALPRLVQPRQRIDLDVEGKRFECEIVWCRDVQFGFYIAGCRLLVTS